MDPPRDGWKGDLQEPWCTTKSACLNSYGYGKVGELLVVSGGSERFRNRSGQRHSAVGGPDVPPPSGKLSPVLLTTRGLEEMTSAALQRGCQS